MATSVKQVNVMETSQAELLRPPPHRRCGPYALLFAFGCMGATAGCVFVGALLSPIWVTALEKPVWAARPSRFEALAPDPKLVSYSNVTDHVPRFVKQTVYIPAPDNSANHLHLDYDAEITDGLTWYALDYEDGVLDVGCFEGGLHLALATPESAAALQPGVIVTGSHWWGCDRVGLTGGNNASRTTAPTAILHRVVSVYAVPAANATVSLQVEEVALHEVFRALTDHVSHGLHHFGHEVKDVAGKVHDDVHDVVHGDFHAHYDSKQLKTFMWNPLSDVHVGPLNAKGSAAELKFGVNFSLVVHDWHVQTAEIAALVTPDIQVGAGVALTSSGLDAKTWTKDLVHSDSLGSLNFAIGPVPVHITADMSLKLEAHLQLGGSVDLVSSGRMKRRTNLFGVTYDRDSGKGWTEVHRKLDEAQYDNLTHTSPTISATKALDAKLSIVPSLAMNVDFIGGPTIDAAPFLDLSVDVGKVACASSKDKLEATLGWGFGVQVSAAIKLHFHGVLKKLDHTFSHWGPKSVYSTPLHQLEQKCF